MTANSRASVSDTTAAARQPHLSLNPSRTKQTGGRSSCRPTTRQVSNKFGPPIPDHIDASALNAVFMKISDSANKPAVAESIDRRKHSATEERAIQIGGEVKVLHSDAASSQSPFIDKLSAGATLKDADLLLHLMSSRGTPSYTDLVERCAEYCQWYQGFCALLPQQRDEDFLLARATETDVTGPGKAKALNEDWILSAETRREAAVVEGKGRLRKRGRGVDREARRIGDEKNENKIAVHNAVTDHGGNGLNLDDESQKFNFKCPSNPPDAKGLELGGDGTNISRNLDNVCFVFGGDTVIVDTTDWISGFKVMSISDNTSLESRRSSTGVTSKTVDSEAQDEVGSTKEEHGGS